MEQRCECGCGGFVDLTRGRPTKRFIHGHNPRGIARGPMLDETKRKLAAVNGWWTGDELAVLKASYATLYIDQLQELLPGRSRGAIFLKAQKTGLSKSGDPSLSGPEKIRQALKGRITGARNPHWNGGVRQSDKRTPLEHAARSAEKRAKLFGAYSEPVSLDAVIARDGMVCRICGSEVAAGKLRELSFDHIVPLSKGGTHTEDNIQVAHFVCNQRKGNRV